MKKCQNCNFDNEDNAVFCSNCGKKLKKVNKWADNEKIEKFIFPIIWFGLFALLTWTIVKLATPTLTVLGIEEGATWPYWVVAIILILIILFRK